MDLVLANLCFNPCPNFTEVSAEEDHVIQLKDLEQTVFCKK